MKSKKIIVALTTVIAAALIVVGTFAWFTTTDRVQNVMDMEAFDVTLTEAFDPDVPVIPGADLTKDITVANKGNMDVLVRVKMEEALSLLEMVDSGDKLKITYTDSETPTSGQKAVLISAEMVDAYKAAGYAVHTTNIPAGVTVLRKSTKTGTNTVYTYMGYVTDTNQVVKLTLEGSKDAPTKMTAQYAYHIEKATPVTDAIHGTTVGEQKLDAYIGGNFHDSVVLNFAKNVQVDGQDLSATANWYLCNDGYFYYTKALKGNSLSEGLLSSVTMKQEMVNIMQGATYKLTPVMEAVQVNHDAVKATWADLATGYPASQAVVTANNAKQLVYNIVVTGTAYKGV